MNRLSSLINANEQKSENRESGKAGNHEWTRMNTNGEPEKSGKRESGKRATGKPQMDTDELRWANKAENFYRSLSEDQRLKF